MRDSFSQDEEQQLDQVFVRYRAAFPEVEPSANFMPELWARIDSRHTFSFVFGRLSRTFASLSAAVCLLLVVMNLMARPENYGSYTDALLADSSAERTYYTEAIRSTPPTEDLSPR